MSLPPGVDLDTVRAHALTLSIVSTTINLTGAYLTAPDSSPEEDQNEAALNEHVERVVALGPDVCGSALLAFASLLSQTADETTVQAWFDEQSTHIREALADEQ